MFGITTASIITITFIVTCVTASNELASHELAAHFDGLLTSQLLTLSHYNPSSTLYMHLAKKRIVSVQQDCFTAYTKLKYLDLANNQMTIVRLNNTSLEQLILRNNKLTSFDDLLGVSGLKRLDLSENRLKSVAFAGHANLEVLDLSFNKLSILTARMIGNLASLRHLDLSNNFLTEIQPESFG